MLSLLHLEGGLFTHMVYSVIMVLTAYASYTKPVILKYCYLFRQNESHYFSYIQAQQKKLQLHL